MSFRKMSLPTPVLASLVKNSTAVPTSIQTQAIPSLLKGESAILLATCGDGKTLAFLLPMIARLTSVAQTKQSLMRALVITPNDQLAKQVFDVAQNYHDNTKLLTGKNMHLKHGTDLVVTSFQVLHQLRHMHQKLFQDLEVVAVDEMDLTFGDGDRNKQHKPLATLDNILKVKPQMIFACATLPKGPLSAQQMVKNRLPNVKIITTDNAHRIASTCKQHFIDTDSDLAKDKELLTLIKEERKGNKLIVFANSSSQVEEITDKLQALDGVDVFKLHQRVKDRQETLEKFTSPSIQELEKTQVLVCTDVTARGFDFKHIQKVVQYDCPTNVVTYIHRAGRTSRCGESGELISFVGESDRLLMNEIKQRQDSHLQSLFSRKRSLRDRQKKK